MKLKITEEIRIAEQVKNKSLRRVQDAPAREKTDG
jgi:hypothetical protein